MKIKDEIVVITGGASGIGKIMGRTALEKGASCLVIWDINEKNLEATVSEFSKLGKVKGYKVDVSDIESIDKAYEATKAECGPVGILINNAGIITNNKTFDAQTDQDIIRTMNINSVAPMLLTRRVLPDMLERNHGHICTIASAAGLLAMPKLSVYAASKWASFGWSESMRIELQEAKSKVRVTTVAPYFINTGMFDGIQPKVFKLLNPEKTAKTIIRAIEKDKRICGMPFAFRFIRFNQGLMHSKVFDWVFGSVFGVYDSMTHFVGRK